jgi:Gly-Xaa carboxypeptidase
MSILLAELEANPYKPTLDPESPFLKYLSCISEHAPDVPKALRSAVKNPKKWPALAKDLASRDRRLNSFLATTQAIDLVRGGVKVNALPEVVTGTFWDHIVRIPLIGSCSHDQPPNILVSLSILLQIFS